MPEPLELRLYRKLLRFFPEKFQRDYADEMLAAFRDGLGDAKSERRLPAFWLESLVDAIASLRREHRRHKKGVEPVMIRYDDSARLLFYCAREEHRKLRQSRLVGSEHLLLALVQLDSPTAQVLREAGCTLELLWSHINEMYGPEAVSVVLNEAPSISPDLRHTVELAAKLARERRDLAVKPRHMLLAILEQPQSVAYRALQRFASPETLRVRI